ncbi:hypothetical protein [Haloarcula argentinensis]|uniref:hypothetical protein n=1 Tax=Haloarcula argentinensis TaxID=43776 RepID=UPI0002B254FE|nr:hypothetical protein C443_20802 [Haloarcula argentinensis DSM 12282]
MPSSRSRLKSPVSLVVFSIGVYFLVLGALGALADTHPAIGVSGWGLYADRNLEVIGVLTGGVALLGESVLIPAGCDTPPTLDCQTVYMTEPLQEMLLSLAAEAEPDTVSFGLAVTPAGELEAGIDAPDQAPVFSDVYLPEAPNSVSSVFGIDLSTPPQRTQGRFISHPRSGLEVTKRDDLHEVVFVAVPPWDDASIAAFDRAGRRHRLETVDAAANPDVPEPVNI